MASQACHGAETAEMMWISDGDHHIPTPARFIPQVSRTILNPCKVSGRSNRTGSARTVMAKAAEMINQIHRRRAVPRLPDRAYVWRDLCRRKRPTLPE